MFKRSLIGRVAARSVLALMMALTLLGAAPHAYAAANCSPTTATELVTAVNDANADNCPNNTITLVAGTTYTFATPSYTGDTFDGDAALPRITGTVIIEGNGAIIERGSNANSRFRIFLSYGPLTLRNLILRNGAAQEGGNALPYGGCIASSGTLTIQTSTITNCSSATTGDGAAVSATTTTVIDSSTITNNSGQYSSVIIAYGVGTIHNSTIDPNGRSSGVDIEVGTLTLINSTITGAQTGVNVYYNGTLNLKNSIVAGNSTNIYKESGTISDQGNNVLSGDPRLAPLANNGGPTRTHALLPNSPAINTGDAATCADANGVNNKDQRGQARTNDQCDIGAYEVQPAATNLNVAAATSTYGGTASLSATLTQNSNPVGNRTVTFTLNGTTVGSATTNASGVATLADVSLSGINAGSYSGAVVATFAGASPFKASNGSATLTVTKATTTTAITSDTPDPSKVGQAVIVKYSVTSPAGTPTGDVTVQAGTDSCTATVAAGQCDITFTSGGAKTITASYSGDTNFNGSTSDGVAHNVNQAPTAISLNSASVAENQPSGTTVGTFSTTDADAGDTFTYALVSGAGDTDNASFTISGNTLKTAASFDYETKNNYSIRVQVTDSAGNTFAQLVTISVTDVQENVAPVARNDTFSTNEDTQLTGNVLSNDSDANSDTLTAVKVSDPAHGTLTLNANGSFTYTPAANYNGSDSFSYKANDGTLDSNVATVSLTVNAVNDAPTATDDSVTTNEDTSTTVNVLANDSDVDGSLDPASVSVTVAPTKGNASVNPTNGAISYTPNANATGADSFSYRVCDSGTPLPVKCATATVSITITPVNDAPIATNDSASTNEDVPLTGNVLANDSDVDGNTLTAIKVSDPAHGTLTLNTNGSFTYTPAANYNGPDSFSYKANDGTADSNVATVSLTVNAVNDAPTVAVAAGGTCLGDFKGQANLTLGDVETAAGSLTLAASSSNTALVPVGNISFGGAGANRTITIATVSGKSGSATITLIVGDGSLSSTTTITVFAGTSNNDSLTGTNGADMLFAGNGQDTLQGNGGNDLLCAGNGDDTLQGGDGADMLDAGTGQDKLDGGLGNDTLLGGQGDDQLTGGAGADAFDGGQGNDRASDFSAAQGDTQRNIP